MRRIGIMIMILLAGHGLYAQNFENLSFGTDSTLDIMTWNIEWFPKNINTTPAHVSSIIESLDPDIIAVQEIDSTEIFEAMINSMPDYEYSIYSSYFMGLAYIYKTETITPQSIYEIYTEYDYWNIFPRSPLVMEFTYKGMPFTILNNHLKCCGDGSIDMGNTNDEEYRRYQATELLKTWLDDEKPDMNVIMLGDFNDMLTDEPSNNVFQAFIDDADNYEFTDMAIEEGNNDNWSYPTWPSHLDHILISDELFDIHSSSGSGTSTIFVDNAYSSYYHYDESVTDHRPVGIKLKPAYNTKQDVTERPVSLYPNPATDKIFIEGAKNASICIINTSGQCVTQIHSRSEKTEIDISALSPGVYGLVVDDSQKIYRQKIIKY